MLFQPFANTPHLECVLQGTGDVSINRRRTMRIRTDLPVVWKRGRRSIATRLRDMSADGMLLETDEDFPLQTCMDLTIELPTGPVTLMAVSRLCGTTKLGRGIGVSILAMDHRERSRWTAFYRAALKEAVGNLPPSVSRLFVEPE